MSSVLRNEFSWSVSRDGTLQECPRKYYFSYYGSWGGWESSAPERVREIYLLKKLKSRPLWIGEVVHECISRSLINLSRGIPVLPLEEILSITRDRMRQDFRHSKSLRYRENPKAYTGLFEHEYEVDVSDAEWKAAAEQVDRCLVNFYTSEHYRRLTHLEGRDFLEIEKFSSFALDGIKIHVRLDCAVAEDGRIVVWDWKTGKSSRSGFPLQLACYAWYSGEAFETNPTQVRTRQFELYDGIVHEQSLTTRSFEELFSYIRGSIADMRGLLDDPAENRASEDSFAKVERANVCLRCNYLKVCRPDI